LTPAIRQRTHWIFLTDNEHGQEVLYAFHSLMTVAGVFGLLTGKHPRAEDCGFGFFDFLNHPTRHTSRISILTCPKYLLDAEQINAVLHRHCGSDLKLDGQKDFVILQDEDSDRVAIQLFLQSMESGTFTLDTDTGAN